MTYTLNIIAKSIRVEGLVQGVGFRPFVYRLAKFYDIKGWVNNNNECVIIFAEGKRENIESFIKKIKLEAPISSQIEAIVENEESVKTYNEFSIKESQNISEAVTQVSPDIAVCNDCILDMNNQFHRIDYPLINCTNCGPRFSIIRDLPYDRVNTTMEEFEMCETCKHEYNDVADRRFHAQPVSCNNCGPKYFLHINDEVFSEFNYVLNKSVEFIDEGKVIAIKGTGGFFIACDANNEEAVALLRKRKIREGKPFALMFSNIEKLKEYAFVNEQEQIALSSWRKPIVIVKTKKELAKSVSLGINTIGAMLPNMPFHYLLFEQLKTKALVLTSGNISDEPIVILNKIAITKLASISDAVITYDRKINNRTDDSVVFVANNKLRQIRRSRGYVPNPIRVNCNVEGVFAAGAEFTNCFALGKAKQVIMSQHIGDLKNMETLDFYKESYNLFKRLYRFEPSLVVSDMHPDYLSTRFANELGIKKIEVQHHHAHIASCMSEHGLDEKVIGVCFDGTGFGTDRNIWGGEFFICNLQDFTRFTHFEYIPLPGGDKVTYEPWRTAFSYLHNYFGNEIKNMDLEFLNNIDKKKQSLIIQAIDKKINSPLSSSAGRLFDAVSAMLNLCTISTFHAEAPMRLENCADANCNDKYSFNYNKEISFKPMFTQILEDVKKKKRISIISAKFHNTVVDVVLQTAMRMRDESGINKVCLSGGTFQNRIILEKSEQNLFDKKFRVFSNLQVPSNDGGLALGQLMIGAKLMR